MVGQPGRLGQHSCASFPPATPPHTPHRSRWQIRWVRTAATTSPTSSCFNCQSHFLQCGPLPPPTRGVDGGTTWPADPATASTSANFLAPYEHYMMKGLKACLTFNHLASGDSHFLSPSSSILGRNRGPQVPPPPPSGPMMRPGCLSCYGHAAT
jgi:hypothetical protein